ncbi:MAG TPA: response regulator [Spirochaetia bacterium]|nr:response regulator [Spirochaetia bacterium]
MAFSVLIIDDSVIVRSGLETMFAKSDHWDRVLSAANGKEGLETLKREGPDIVCLDIEMPEMDGLEVLKEVGALKRSGAIAAALPVVVLSGTMHENEPNVRRAKMLGAADVLAKPEGKSATLMINFAQLEERLLRLLG